MTDSVTSKTDLKVVARAVAAVAGDLNISRRNWLAYPSGHPATETALNKLLVSLNYLSQLQSPVRIGITRDGLLLGDEFVEKGNLVCASIAGAFFERGAGTVSIVLEPNQDELKALMRLMTTKRDEILAAGGIEKLWNEAGITFMTVHNVRYDRFSGTEETTIDASSNGDRNSEATGSLWERFVRRMIQGDVSLYGSGAAGDIRPEALAAALNSRYTKRTGQGGGFSSTVVRNSLEVIREILNAATVTADTDESSAASVKRFPVPESSAQKEILAFISALDPTLRRQILDGFYEIGGDSELVAADLLFWQLRPAMLQETYATAEEYSTAPPLLQGILRKLLPHMTGTYETATPHDEIRNKVRTLLLEHRQEIYIPDEYLSELQDLLAENSPQPVEMNEIQLLFSGLDPSAVEIHSSEIIMQLVLSDPDGENSQELIQNLTDTCGYFLQLGDYDQVLKLLRQGGDSRLTSHLLSAFREAFCRPEFLDEILSGLTVWGKSKYDQVTQLIQIIGTPFIDPLLDRLAFEENMSLRRFLMDRVLAFGDAAIIPLTCRLDDQRWYVLRNIVVMLRTLAPGQEASRLRPLLKNSNEKLRHEVIISLLQAGDPIAQRQLLRDLSSNNHAAQLAAVTLIDKASSLEIAQKLAEIVVSGGFSAAEYELKAACVEALAKIGKPEILPELVKVLRSISLLGYKTLNRLKITIVRSFEKYPDETVLPILERLASGADAVATQALETLRSIRYRRT